MDQSPGLADLLERYHRVRRVTERLCAPLRVEDCVPQSMPEASPVRWHLGHVTWFFETFILKPANDYHTPDPAYAFLFDPAVTGSGAGRVPRGLLTRPGLDAVMAWRSHVDAAVQRLLERSRPGLRSQWVPLVELGLAHEQQHQELLLADAKHLLSLNPTRPTWRDEPMAPSRPVPPMGWVPQEGGLHWLGREDGDPAHVDERPRHRAFLHPFALSDRLVTSGEYQAFMEDGGYDRPELWSREGWSRVRQDGWRAPLYWQEQDDAWVQTTLNGVVPLDLHEPVCHVSWYEADAFARWAGARLPGEAEWEVAARDRPVTGNLLEEGRFHPRSPDAPAHGAVLQLFGDCWEWTTSAHGPYPGGRPTEGAIGEYGAIHPNHFVLRGGSCLTSGAHLGPTVRNHFPPESRWQFTGIRLAREIE